LITQNEISGSLTKVSLTQNMKFNRVSNEQGIILSTEGIQHLNGAVYLDVLSLCSSGSHTYIELINLLNSSHNDMHIWYAASILFDKGYLEKLEDKKKYCKLPHFQNLLELKWDSCKTDEVPTITLLTDFDSEEATAAYTLAMRENKNWLPIVLCGNIPSVGPVFTPDGLCLECLIFRIRENKSIHTWIERNTPNDLEVSHWIDTNKFFGFQKKIHDFARQWSPQSRIKNQLISLSTDEESYHIVVKRPECNKCGDSSLVSKKMHAPIFLEQSSQTLDYKVAYRSIYPQETWNTHKHNISPITGIIGNLHPVITADQTRFHVYSANFSSVPSVKSPAIEDFKTTVFGKGRNADAAKVSALCEGIERASVRYRGDEHFISGSLEQMGYQAIAPEAIQHFTQDQILNPRKTLSLGATPKIRSNNEIIEWLPAWSITHNERRFIPADAVLLQRPIPADSRVAIFESNGLSAGNTLEEAILQGLLELIERDAVSIWWFNKLERPPFDITKMENDTWFMQTVTNLKKDNVDVFLLDLTIDTKTPVVATIGRFKTGWLAGYGCHFDSRIAASRSLSELVQVRALMNPVTPPKECTDLSYLYPNTSTKLITPDLRYLDSPQNTKSFIEIGTSLLANIGIDTIVVNCTRPDINMPVVKVFAPGLRAFRPRFSPGRLYDIPFKLGLLSHPKSISDLNPLWMTV